MSKPKRVNCKNCFHRDVCEFANDSYERECGHYADGGKTVQARELAKEKAKNETLLKMVDEARKREAGYNQIAKIHSSYIAILLNKLGATADNTITINAEEVTKAMEKYEARAMYSPESKSYNLYCEVIE